jgi:tetratricopeptide (TPR) repeat protein
MYIFGYGLIRRAALLVGLACALLLNASQSAAQTAAGVFVPISDDLLAAVWSGDLAQALREVNGALALSPGDLELGVLVIDLHLSMGQPSLALSFAQAEVQRNEQSADAYVLVGRAHIAPNQALASYEQALSLNPQHARAHLGRGSMLRVKSRHEEARASFERAATLQSGLEEAWSGWVLSLLDQGQAEEAKNVLRKGLEAAPGASDLSLMLSVLEPAEGVLVLQGAIQRQPRDPRLYTALAELQLQAGKAWEAQGLARKALKLSPQRKDAALSLMFADQMVASKLDLQGYRDLLKLRSLDGSQEQARKLSAELVERYPGCSLVWMERARVDSEKPAMAIAALKQALELDGDNIEIRAALGAALAPNHPREAIDHLERAYRVRPQDTSLALKLAGAYAKAGRLEQSLESLVDLIAIEPSPAALVMLAAVARELGRIEFAIALIEDVALRTRQPDLLALAKRLRSAPKAGGGGGRSQ